MNTATHHPPTPSPAWEGKVAIVTGAGQGIGFAICRSLISRGVRVLLNDTDETLAKTAAATLAAEAATTTTTTTTATTATTTATPTTTAPIAPTPACLALPGDAADIPFIRRMVDTAVKTFGRLDIVIANAGLTLFGDFFSYPPESFSRVMQLNLGGSFFLAQAAAGQMRKQGNGGSILFTSSVTGHQAHKQLAAYGMSKAALEMLARSLVLDLSPHGITINTVAPGATLTERTAGDASYETTWSALTPMGRPANVEDIANAVLFLVSPEARHITGQTLIVDGGWTVVSPGP